MSLAPSPLTAGRRRSSPQREEKRERILTAATRIFAERGFAAARIADIAREAGVGDGTIYLYFEGKDHLLASIFARRMDRFLARARRVLVERTEPVERLRRVAALHLGHLGRDPDLAAVVQIELRGNRTAMRQFSKDRLHAYFELLTEIVADGQERGRFRRGLKPRIVAGVVFGALDEIVTHWVLAEKPSDLKEAGRVAIDVLMNGIVEEGMEADS